MDQGQNEEYQKIIDDYARLTSTEINHNNSKIGTKPKPEPIPSNLIEDLSSPPPVNLSPPPPPPSIPSPPLLPLVALSPGHGFNPFKYLFIFSLIVFLGVSGTLAYSFYQKYLVINSTETTTPTSVPAPSVTPLPTATCQLNDQSYKVGQSFAAADGCNTCTCSPDLIISCTELDCSSVTPSAATQSSIPADWKTYENKNLGFSLQYPLSFSKKDNLQTKLTSTPLTTNILSFTDEQSGINISIMINPDGFGYFPDKNVKITYQPEKGIVPTETETNTENIDPAKVMNVYIGKLKTGFDFLAIASFPRKENMFAIEDLISQILSTFKFL